MTSDPRALFTTGLTKRLEALLQEQDIQPGNPGPILLDVELLMDAIGEGIPTSSKYFALPQAKLDELNGQLTEPLRHRLKRPQLKSFPTLMGLFLLLRSTGLAVGETKPKQVVLIDPAMLEQWDSFNPTERYMVLLESWLSTATWDAVGERHSRSQGMAVEVQQVYCRLTDTITKLADDRFGLFYGFTDSVTLSLLHQFGWVRLTYDSTAAEGKAASLRFVERLPLGDAMFAATCGIHRFADNDPTSFRETFQPFFPEWKRGLTLPAAEFRDGEHTLKLSWGKVWRRVVAPADTSLDEVAHALLDAFNFDHDHLYQFEFRNSQGQQVQVVCPMLDDAEFFTDEFLLGDLPIAEGDAITMLYDFGDNWQFNIKLEQISDTPSRRSAPKVTKRSGRPPNQYGYDDL